MFFPPHFSILFYGFLILLFLAEGKDKAMPHQLKGVQYATDLLERIDDKTFDRGTLNGTEKSTGGIRLERNEVTLRFAKKGTYTSPVFRNKFPFNELLPSWNVTLPGETGFRIDLRLSNNGKQWSPWLYLGSDGITESTEKDDKITSHDDILVDVDYILMDNTKWFTQFRVSLFSKNGHDSSILHHITLSYSNSMKDMAIWEQYADSRDDLTSVPASICLNVPYISQLTAPEDIKLATCCAASVAMVLNYWGRKISFEEVIEVNYDTEYKIYGNWPKTAQTLWRYGLHSCVRRYRNFQQVYDTLKKGIPIIASLQVKKGELTSAAIYTETKGHILVIHGMDRRGNILVCDPWANNEKEGKRPYKKSEMQAIWLDKGGVGIIGAPFPVYP